MFYITLDLEWNQAYAQKAIAVQKQLSSRLRGEVIQIGAVKLDRNLRPCGSYSVIVKPKYFKKIHKHVAQLTGISQAQMDLGVSLPEAAEGFRRFCGKDFAFLTWGPDDIPMLKENFNVHKLDASWLDRTYDLQVIFAREIEGSGSMKQRSLEYAMEYFNIPQNLPAHDALNDAYFTALVAARLDVAGGIRNYDASRGQYLASSVIGDADAGDDGYVTIGEMLEDDCVAHPLCPLCKRPLTPTGKPLHSKGQRYLSPFSCTKDGNLFLTLKIQRNLNDTFRARRTITRAGEDALAEYRRRSEENGMRKKSRSRRGGRKRRRKSVTKDASTQTQNQAN